MAAGDVTVIGPIRPSELDAAVTGAAVVADDITMCSYGNGMVIVLIVKAA